MHRASHHMRVGHFTAKAAVFIALFPAVAWASSSAVPDWVKAAAQQPLPSLPETTKAIVLLDDETYTVDARGQAVEHVRRVVKILRPRAGMTPIPLSGSTRIPRFSPSMPGASTLPGTSTPSRTTRWPRSALRVKETISITKTSRPRSPTHPAGTPAELSPGSTRSERPYLAETDWEFQGSLPVASQSFTLELPAGYTYSTTWAHHPKVDAIDLEHQRYRWEMNN